MTYVLNCGRFIERSLLNVFLHYHKNILIKKNLGLTSRLLRIHLYYFTKAACKRTQQLPTLLRRQQCWELLRACWQRCANGCNNSQQVWDLQCIVGRIQPTSLCNPCVMSVGGPNNVGRAVQTDPTLLRYASAITEQKKCWELLAEKFDRFQTLRNNMQQGVQTDATCNIQQCWELLVTMLRPFARGLNFTLTY